MVTSIQRHNLICCITDCCGGRNYFRANTIMLTEFRYSGLIDTRHSTKWSGNKMQLVLNDKLRRFFVICNTKQRRRFVVKGNLSKFIYSCDNEGWQMLVNCIINNVNGETTWCRMKMAMLIWTFDCHSILNQINIIVLCIQFFSTPRTNLDLHRI